MKRMSSKLSANVTQIVLLVFCFITVLARADGAPDKTDRTTTGSTTAGQQASMISQLIAAGSTQRPPIWREKIYYDGQDKSSLPLDSMNELLQLYTDEELLSVTEISWSSCRFDRIKGLNRLPNLKILRLGGNRITAISGLEDTPLLEIINLSQNRIERIEGLESLPNLRELHLSNNRIKRIEGLDSFEKLEVLMLEGNQITEISGLGRLTALRRLGLAGNRPRDVDGLLELGDLNDLSIRSLYNQLDDKALETIAEWNRRHADNPFVQL